MLQKILKQNYTNNSAFSTSSHTQSFGPLNLNSCYTNDYSFSVSSQYFSQVAGQTILQSVLPCTAYFDKRFHKKFCKTLLTKNFTMSNRHKKM